MTSNGLTEGQEILEGRFTIVKRLGSGAFGEIYKGKLFGKQDEIRLTTQFQNGNSCVFSRKCLAYDTFQMWQLS